MNKKLVANELIKIAKQLCANARDKEEHRKAVAEIHRTLEDFKKRLNESHEVIGKIGRTTRELNGLARQEAKVIYSLADDVKDYQMAHLKEFSESFRHDLSTLWDGLFELQEGLRLFDFVQESEFSKKISTPYWKAFDVIKKNTY